MPEKRTCIGEYNPKYKQGAIYPCQVCSIASICQKLQEGTITPLEAYKILEVKEGRTEKDQKILEAMLLDLKDMIEAAKKKVKDVETGLSDEPKVIIDPKSLPIDDWELNVVKRFVQEFKMPFIIHKFKATKHITSFKSPDKNIRCFINKDKKTGDTVLKCFHYGVKYARKNSTFGPVSVEEAVKYFKEQIEKHGRDNED